jgi:hypothetical protein
MDIPADNPATLSQGECSQNAPLWGGEVPLPLKDLDTLGAGMNHFPITLFEMEFREWPDG